MLWDKNPVRARGLFVDAGAVLAQMNIDVDRTDRNEMQSVNQLRQELVLGAGRHDAELGYQLLHSTQPQASATNSGNGRRLMPDMQSNLEQSLLATIAATDPKVAYQKAVEALDKGEYPTAVARMLAQLQTKDKEAFDKLSTKVLSKLGQDNLACQSRSRQPGAQLVAARTASGGNVDQYEYRYQSQSTAEQQPDRRSQCIDSRAQWIGLS